MSKICELPYQQAISLLQNTTIADVDEETVSNTQRDICRLVATLIAPNDLKGSARRLSARGLSLKNFLTITNMFYKECVGTKEWEDLCRLESKLNNRKEVKE